jgi:hypothetical protein
MLPEASSPEKLPTVSAKLQPAGSQALPLGSVDALYLFPSAVSRSPLPQAQGADFGQNPLFI